MVCVIYIKSVWIYKEFSPLRTLYVQSEDQATMCWCPAGVTEMKIIEFLQAWNFVRWIQCLCLSSIEKQIFFQDKKYSEHTALLLGV